MSEAESTQPPTAEVPQGMEAQAPAPPAPAPAPEAPAAATNALSAPPSSSAPPENEHTAHTESPAAPQAATQAAPQSTPQTLPQTFTPQSNGSYSYSQSPAPQPQQPQQNADIYHSTPPAGTVAQQQQSAPMNLPSIHSVDGRQQFSPQQPAPAAQTTQAPIGSPLPSSMPPMPPMGQYMPGYAPGMPQMGVPPNAQMRYQIPGDPSKMLSGARHKKEVKRRTKTGCLTCRKRRIKCDEGHPVCRNCVKSKRECLGYDPVFRPQPAPSAIQPAPNPPPSLVVAPQEPPQYPGAPPGYVPAVTQPFAPSLQSDSPTPSLEHTDYGSSTAIDPALESNTMSAMANIQHAVEGNLQAGGNSSAGVTPISEGSALKAKQVKIADLLALRGVPPPPPHPIVPIQQARLDEIQAVFLATYAPAIDKFLETRWFQDKALSQLLTNAQLMAEYSALIDAFNDRNLGDPAVLSRVESFEASVVWQSMCLCRNLANRMNGSASQDPELITAAKRLNVFEALVTGEYLEINPLTQPMVQQPPPNATSLTLQLHQRAVDFWSAVGHFLTLHDDEASSAKEIDDTLARCRTLLDTYENRDVIYSIAIARHLGQRWADFPRSVPQPTTTDEKDAGAKLFVAQKFLEQEAAGKGTTQVIKRICGMVVRSWTVSRQ
ncbi:C6 finger domain protein, putative [Paecilomyces variotii No. 5]|uniref:C6 finger domain protein, putative n=1 Tax=Byssochlamys spectabilis (strain No. 5 / NBRC 109023) TaxID=1356009 RepID=V5G161_BYSSN|nr:C6 finger domain protein, putative [Paecilomyces variotii No. 5]